MRVFISWSGAQSKSVATALQGLLVDLKSGFEPWMSSQGIAAGSVWWREVFSALTTAEFGVICVSRSSLRSAWVQFEAGAMSISVPQSRLCPYLIDVKSTELTGPLSAFQSCEANEGGTWNLLSAMNGQLQEPKSEQLLRKRYQKLWPNLLNVLSSPHQSALPPLDPADYNRLDAAGVDSLLEIHFLASARRLQAVIHDALSKADGKVDRINFPLLGIAATHELHEGRLLLAPFHSEVTGSLKAFLDEIFPVAELDARLRNGIGLAAHCRDGAEVMAMVDRLIRVEQTNLKDRLQARLGTGRGGHAQV